MELRKTNLNFVVENLVSRLNIDKSFGSVGNAKYLLFSHTNARNDAERRNNVKKIDKFSILQKRGVNIVLIRK